jgi:hypothetical protein
MLRIQVTGFSRRETFRESFRETFEDVRRPGACANACKDQPRSWIPLVGIAALLLVSASRASAAITSVNSTATTSSAITVPAGVQNGDLLLAFYSYWSFATATAPSGWQK